MSPTLYQSDLRISNHRGHKFPPSLTLLSFKTRIEWPPVLIATANFASLLFQLLQYPRQSPSYSAHRAALMTKTGSIFPAFSSRFVDFAVQFCFRCKFSFHEKRRSSQVWQWRDFSRPITILCHALYPIWWWRKKAIWRDLLSIQMKQSHWLLCAAKEFWLVQENHATVKLDLSVAFRGFKTYSESKIELRNVQILKKMLEK